MGPWVSTMIWEYKQLKMLSFIYPAHACLTVYMPVVQTASLKQNRQLEWIRNVSQPHKHFHPPEPKRENPSLVPSHPVKNDMRQLIEHKNVTFPVLKIQEYHASFDLMRYQTDTTCYWHVSALPALSWVTAVAQTCVCRRYKSTGTGLNNNCALITHWSFHWVTAEGDSTDSRDLLNRQRASWFSANYLLLAWDQVWIADQ